MNYICNTNHHNICKLRTTSAGSKMAMIPMTMAIQWRQYTLIIAYPSWFQHIN